MPQPAGLLGRHTKKGEALTSPIAISGRLKTWPGDLDEIVCGKKKAEIRRCDDRSFRAGQIWELYAWDPERHVALDLLPVQIRITHVERMAGPLIVGGIQSSFMTVIPLAVLSFEIV